MSNPPGSVDLTPDSGIGQDSSLCPACGEPLPQEESVCSRCSRPLLLQGRYRLCRLLGAGGQGRTFAARDEQTGELVAVKQLSLGQVQEWKTVELFQRSSEMLRRLDHPGIPRCLADFTEVQGGITLCYQVEQFVAGASLDRVLARGERFGEVELRRIAREVLGILDHLARQAPPLVHRDVKPANLMRRPDGSLALIDFDLVGTVLTAAAGSTLAVGTPGYAPLEQYVGMAVPASDLYALGATLASLATRRDAAELMPPGEHRIELRGQVELEPGFSAFLARLLAPDLARRYASPGEALADLDRLDRGELPIRPAGVGVLRRATSRLHPLLQQARFLVRWAWFHLVHLFLWLSRPDYRVHGADGEPLTAPVAEGAGGYRPLLARGSVRAAWLMLGARSQWEVEQRQRAPGSPAWLQQHLDEVADSLTELDLDWPDWFDELPEGSAAFIALLAGGTLGLCVLLLGVSPDSCALPLLLTWVGLLHLVAARIFLGTDPDPRPSLRVQWSFQGVSLALLAAPALPWSELLAGPAAPLLRVALLLPLALLVVGDLLMIHTIDWDLETVIPWIGAPVLGALAATWVAPLLADPRPALLLPLWWGGALVLGVTGALVAWIVAKVRD